MTSEIFELFTATEYHLGLLKAKLAKYRQQLLEPTGKAGAKVSVIHVITNEIFRFENISFCVVISYFFNLKFQQIYRKLPNVPVDIRQTTHNVSYRYTYFKLTSNVS